MEKSLFQRSTGRGADKLVSLLSTHGLRLPTAAHGRLVASYLCFLHAHEPAGIPWKPKILLAVNLVLSAGLFGYPRLLGNWIDESDNRKLSLVASAAAAPIWQKGSLPTLHTNRDLPLRRTRRSQKNTEVTRKRKTLQLAYDHPSQITAQQH